MRSACNMTLPANPDVVVVGAGAAGLSAAKALQARGLSVIVLEADSHVGGRCITDTTTFSTPFDRGGSWLHSAPINPLARLAETGGESLHKAPWDWSWVHTPDGPLQAADMPAYRCYQDTMWEKINQAGRGATDMPVATALPPSPWRDTAKHWVEQMLGGDADVTSAVDVHRYDDAKGDWLVAGGLGAFIRRLHSDVQVRLNCPVTKIDYSGAGVRATTPLGVVQAKRLVLTVSTGVLAAEKIAFIPALPAEKRKAVGLLPMGLLNKVGIEFDPGWAGAHQGQMADYAAGGDAFCSVLFGFYDTSLAVGFLAGRHGDQVEAAGPGAATDFCLQGLRAIFGQDIAKHIRRTDETAWRSNPHTLGAYSYAKPTGADARAILAAPLDDRLFFAGEATMPDAYATVHGAWRSGVIAADAVAGSLC